MVWCWRLPNLKIGFVPLVRPTSRRPRSFFSAYSRQGTISMFQQSFLVSRATIRLLYIPLHVSGRVVSYPSNTGVQVLFCFVVVRPFHVLFFFGLLAFVRGCFYQGGSRQANRDPQGSSFPFPI